MSTFTSQFAFRPELTGFLGVEREQFIRRPDGKLTPAAPDLFTALGGDGRFGYELSACQIETKIGPTSLEALPGELARARDALNGAAGNLNLVLSDDPVAESEMPLDVYPDERYRRLKEKLPRDVLLAACRVIGVHVHVGVGSMDEALEGHNRAARALYRLIEVGDTCRGERLRHYATMAPRWAPPIYRDIEDFEARAEKEGFLENPRDCYHLVRISKHGTVELRMFDGTGDLDLVAKWALIARNVVLGLES